MTLRPKTYKARVIDTQIERYLTIFGGVQIDGPKWCGKTWSGLAHANSVSHLDDEDEKAAVLADKKLALIGDSPHLIDEWQDIPSIRDVVRRAIDDSGSKPGSFLLTGSSQPPREEYSHSGAGRIASLRMRPMSLFEQGHSTGSVSLGGLFDGIFSESRIETSLAELATLICKGGWPAALDMDLDASMVLMRSYATSLFEESAPKKGKNPETARRLLTSLAKNNTTAATIDALASDMAGGEQANPLAKPSRSTVESYLDFFRDMYVFDDIRGWENALRSKKRIRSKPKRYLVDPSIATALLGVTPDRLCRDGQLFGMLFENLCMRDLLTYASGNPVTEYASFGYYRDDNGREVDVILELPDGRWGAIEVKLGEDKINEGEEALLWLADTMALNQYGRARAPEFLMVLVGNTTFVRRAKSGVYIVPLMALKP